MGGAAKRRALLGATLVVVMLGSSAAIADETDRQDHEDEFVAKQPEDPNARIEAIIDAAMTAAASQVTVSTDTANGGTLVEFSIDGPGQLEIPVVLDALVPTSTPGQPSPPATDSGLGAEMEHLLDGLSLVPRLPTSLPVTLCARVDLASASDNVQVIGPVTTAAPGAPLALQPTGEESWVSDCNYDDPEGGWQPISDGVAQALLLPKPAAAPAATSAEFKVEVRLVVPRELDPSSSEPSSFTHKDLELAQPVSLPVPQLVIPTVGFAFGGLDFSPKHQDWAAIGIAVPEGSPLDSRGEVEQLLQTLKQTVTDARNAMTAVSWMSGVDVPDAPAPANVPDDVWEDAKQLLTHYDNLGLGISNVLNGFVELPNTEDHGISVLVGDFPDLGAGGPDPTTWVNRDGESDVHVGDDVRSVILFAPDDKWCWYRNNDFGSSSYEFRPELPWLEMWQDTADIPPEGDFRGTGVGGDDDGVSSWRWNC